jgi:hypothetical protein
VLDENNRRTAFLADALTPFLTGVLAPERQGNRNSRHLLVIVCPQA